LQQSQVTLVGTATQPGPEKMGCNFVKLLLALLQNKGFTVPHKFSFPTMKRYGVNKTKATKGYIVMKAWT
jgi:hypothetical protein